MITASIITTCKGRLEFLKESMPSWLAQDVGKYINYGIVVVDYGCPQGTAEWCSSLSNCRVRVAQARNDTDIFNLSRARNIGAASTNADVLAFVDADIHLRNNFLRKYIAAMIDSNAGFSVSGPMIEETEYTSSLCVVDRCAFEFVCGYDETIEGYGEDDTDFFRRLEHAGFARRWLHWDAEHYSCSEEERTQFYQCKDITVSIERNKRHTADPARLVNEQGWGRM